MPRAREKSRAEAVQIGLKRCLAGSWLFGEPTSPSGGNRLHEQRGRRRVLRERRCSYAKTNLRLHLAPSQVFGAGVGPSGQFQRSTRQTRDEAETERHVGPPL